MPPDDDQRHSTSARTGLALGALLACLTIFPRCRTSARQLDDATVKLAGVDRILEEQRREQHLPGLAFAIVKDDRVICAARRRSESCHTRSSGENCDPRPEIDEDRSCRLRTRLSHPSRRQPHRDRGPIRAATLITLALKRPVPATRQPPPAFRAPERFAPRGCTLA